MLVNKMTKNVKKALLFAFDVMLFFVVSLLHYSDFLNFKIFGAGTTILIPLLVAFSMNHSPLTSAMAGMLSGIIMDSSAHGTYCFNAILLLLIGTFVSVSSSTLFNKNLPSAVVISLICSVIYYLLQWAPFPKVSQTGFPSFWKFHCLLQFLPHYSFSLFTFYINTSKKLSLKYNATERTFHLAF